MATLTEGRHAGEHIAYELHPDYCREKATFLTNQDLPAGCAMMLDGSSKLVPYDGATDSVFVGWLFDNQDSTAAGPNGLGDIAGVAYTARGPAIVNGSEVSADGDDTAETILTAAKAASLALGIVVRETS